MDECIAIGTHDPDYHAKMIHSIPLAGVVNRDEFLCSQAKGRRVLDIGASGPMHQALKKVSKEIWGIDIAPPKGDNYYTLDLDLCHKLPPLPVEVVICGEVLEHLGNPRNFLTLLGATYDCPYIITVPNAFGSAGFRYVSREGKENVNLDHVAYYSYYTLSRLVQKSGLTMQAFYWYGGQPRVSEGMIAVLGRNPNG